jgi:hypothetical protein
MLETAGSSLSSHDHLLSAVTVWYVALPFGPATWGRVDVAIMDIVGNERRVEGMQKRFVAASSIHGGRRLYMIGIQTLGSATQAISKWRQRSASPGRVGGCRAQESRLERQSRT